MYNKSSAEFNELINKAGGNALKTRFTFSDFSIEKFTKLEYYGGSNNSDNIAIGTTNMAYLDVSTITDRIITNQEFLFEVGMELSDGTIEYAPMGYFTVQKPDGDEDTINFTAYDRMQKFEKPYFSTLTYPTDSAKVLNELCTICGVELATPITNPITITDKLEGYTCREVLGYIAGIHGFFACFDRYGKLNLRWYSETPIEKQIGLIWALTKSQGNYTVEKITLAKDTETTYTSGTGISGINHSNPYGTQEIADSIYTSLGNFTYRPCEISMLDDIRLDPWDMLKVTYLDGSVLTIPIMSLEHSFTSGETRVKSFGKTDTENEYSYSGPVTQAMDRMATELLVANRIIATKVDAEWVNAHTITADELEATNARVGTLETNSLTADSAVIIKLQTEKLNTSDLNAETAKLGYLTAGSAVIKGKLDANQLSAEVAKLGYLSAKQAEIGYAKIDFSNVGTQVVSSSMIIDGAVTNEKVGNLSANKITSGTIDASKINVTNLNADNLTVGTINGKRIGNSSITLDKLTEEVPTKEYLDSVEKNLQNQIDGAIETFTKTEIPTLNNEPASLWTDSITKKKHIGDICYVVNPTSSADGYCYRFANLGSESSPSYQWVLIKDSDVTKALQDIIDINGEITGIKKFDNEISSWKTDTDNELSSIKARTSTLETEMGTKVESSVFNEVKQTVDENSSSITSLSTTVSKKADSSTVATLTNTVNSVKQTVDTNTSSISSMQTKITKKADGSTVTALTNRVSNVEQNLDGFKTTVSATYTTKEEFNALEIGGTQILRNTNSTTALSSSAKWSEGGWRSASSGTGTKTPIDIIDAPNAAIKKGWQISRTAGTVDIAQDSIPVQYGQTYTISCYARVVEGTPRLRIQIYKSKSEKHITTKQLSDTDTEWAKYSLTFTHDFSTYPNELNAYFGVDNLNGTVEICGMKLEKGNKSTDWSECPKDTESSITAVETIATQTADKFNWLVKSGTSATDFTLTDRTATLISEYINLNGLVTFSGLSSSAVSSITNTIEVGGRNLIRNSAFDNGYAYWSHSAIATLDTTKKFNNHYTIKIASSGQTANKYYGISSSYLPVNPSTINKGDTYTLSFWYYVEDVSTFDYNFIPNIKGTDISTSSTVTLVAKYITPSQLVEGKWTKRVITFTSDYDCSYFYLAINVQRNGTIWVTDFKLEKGNKDTDWSPAPEDVDSAITTADNKAQGIIDNIYTAGTTTINGGKITTGSIKAAQIDVDNLFAQTITATGTISGAEIITGKGKIGGWELADNYITHYNNMTAGTSGTQWQTQLLAEDNPTSSNAAIRLRKRDYDGSSYGSWGNTFYVRYDGYIAAYGGGRIGAWNLGAGYSDGALYSGSKSSFSDTANDGVYLGSDGIALGKGLFKVTKEGAITAASGEIGNWNIGSDRLVCTSSVTSGTASTQWETALLASNSIDYNSPAIRIRKRTYDGSEYGDWGNTFYVRYDGYVTAYGGGKIGAWNLGTGGSGALYNGMTSLTDTKNNGVYIGSNGIALGKGNFKVTNAGVLTANSATIKGTLSAGSIITKGTTSSPTKLGDWCIATASDSGTDFYSFNSTTKLGTGISTSGTNAIGVGFTSTDSWMNAPFRVTHDGTCYAKRLICFPESGFTSEIGNFTINSDGDYIGTSSSENRRLNIYPAGKTISGKGVCYITITDNAGSVIRYLNSSGWH